MEILITGGTGLIGNALIEQLQDHQVTVLTRNIDVAKKKLPPNVKLVNDLQNQVDFNQIDAVINLAGEPIANKRWTEKQKKLICSSRWCLTTKLVSLILTAKTPPQVLLSGSAVGFYGNQGETCLDESSIVHSNRFSHNVCAKWEDIAQQANSKYTRVCILRTGVVLSLQGGALAKMHLPYQFGLGGKIGSGRQYFPWIHIQDMVGGIVHLLHTKTATGVFNFTSPNPVTNKMFNDCLAKQLHRPAVFTMPSLLLKLVMGEASQLLLDSQQVFPRALEANGYHFKFPMLKTALIDLFDSKSN